MAPTLIEPPPTPAHVSPMEATLQLTPLRPFGPGIFTNSRPIWHPPGARGIYGGGAISQSLLAAYKTLPSNEYVIHSMHCYFVLAGDSDTPVIYHVERVRDGRGFVTRTVQARQTGRVIFTATMSFMRRGAGGKKSVTHDAKLPEDVMETCPNNVVQPPLSEQERTIAESNGAPQGGSSPFESWKFPVISTSSTGALLPHAERKTRQWIRARGRISDNITPATTPGGSIAQSPFDTAENGEKLDKHVPHVCSLAYMSDSYFIGTVSRIHGMLRFSSIASIERARQDLENFSSSSSSPSDPSSSDTNSSTIQKYLSDIAKAEALENALIGAAQSDGKEPMEVSMMVSLDHTIYFHNPESFRADDWLFSEMRSPWSGDGRGLVLQHIWSKEGVLICTCVQEGLVRLKEDGSTNSAPGSGGGGGGARKSKL